MRDQERIERFLDGGPFAVVGASTNREKFGNTILRCYMENGHEVFPINPRAKEIEGLECFPDLPSLPKKPHGISVITPSKITEAVVEEAAKAGIENIWMQPGAESDKAIERAEELGMNVIAGGPCLLVVLHFEGH